MPVIPSLRRLRQENPKFEVCRSICATEGDSVSKKQTNYFSKRQKKCLCLFVFVSVFFYSVGGWTQESNMLAYQWALFPAYIELFLKKMSPSVHHVLSAVRLITPLQWFGYWSHEQKENVGSLGQWERLLHICCFLSFNFSRLILCVALAVLYLWL